MTGEGLGGEVATEYVGDGGGGGGIRGDLGNEPHFLVAGTPGRRTPGCVLIVNACICSNQTSSLIFLDSKIRGPSTSKIAAFKSRVWEVERLNVQA